MTALNHPRTRTGGGRRERLKAIVVGLGPFARPHRRRLGYALVASFIVTAAQLALPWPMKGIVELTLAEGQRNPWMSGLIPASGNPVIWLAGAFVVLGFAFGLAEHWQRLAVSRFVVPTINDARVGIFKRLIESSAPEDPRREAGDVVTRVVGDTARLRVGMRGVLVHLLQHGLFLVGVSAVLMAVDVRLGLGYLLGLLLALSVAVVGTAMTERLARGNRGRESRQAEAALRAATETGLELDAKDPDRERPIALITQVKGRAAWAVQGVLSVTACTVLMLAVRLTASGRLTTGDVALVASYLLMLHYPMMRLGRQITRLGPQITSAERLARLAEPSRRRPDRASDTTVAVLSAVNEPCRDTVAAEIGAEHSTARIAAAKAAGAHAFISELPEGYRTPIGSGGGVLLSPAQRLRLNIARLQVVNPPSVLVDDPTAGLDAAAEAAVLPGLEALLRGRQQVAVVSASPAVSAAVVRATSQNAGCRPPSIGAAMPTVRADPALPSLPELLDAHAMAPLFGGMLDSQTVPDVRVHSVRYKPGDNVVVEYAVDTGSGWSTAVAYATAQSGLETKRDRRRNLRLAHRVAGKTPARDPLTYLPEVSALVQWLPLDLRLPLLTLSGKKLARRLANAGVTEVAPERPKLLRYLPRRRAVLRTGPHVVKLYRDALDFEDAQRGLRAVAALHNVRTPPCEAVLPSDQSTVQLFVNGRSPSLRPLASEEAGSLLADLHADTVLQLPRTTTTDILAKSSVRADFAGHLMPELRGELNSLIADLAAAAPPGLPAVTSHGNFHAGQLLASPNGLVMIDVDRLCLAAPAYDLASYAAHVAFGRPGEIELVTATLESLLTGYRERPAGLEWFLANCLLRRLAVPFRHQDEHWPAATASLVASARDSLRCA